MTRVREDENLPIDTPRTPCTSVNEHVYYPSSVLSWDASLRSLSPAFRIDFAVYTPTVTTYSC